MGRPVIALLTAADIAVRVIPSMAEFVDVIVNGQLIDSRLSPSETFSARLGPTPNVIKGWSEGIVGMKVGGIRQLVIPPELAYGDAVLVFTVELVSVQ